MEKWGHGTACGITLSQSCGGITVSNRESPIPTEMISIDQSLTPKNDPGVHLKSGPEPRSSYRFYRTGCSGQTIPCPF